MPDEKDRGERHDPGDVPQGLPPDPWEQDGIDLWALEQAEELARRNVPPDHPAWDHVESDLTIDDFDDDVDDRSELHEGHTDLGERLHWLRKPIAILVIIAWLSLLGGGAFVLLRSCSEPTTPRQDRPLKRASSAGPSSALYDPTNNAATGVCYTSQVARTSA